MEDAIKQQLDHGSTYTASKPCDQVIGELKVLGRLDKTTERLRSGFATRGGFAIAGAVLFFLLAIMTIGITLIFAIPLLIYGIQQLSKRSGLTNYDVPDRLYLGPINMLEKLRADIPPGQPVDIKIDFNHYHDPKYQQSSEGGGVFSNIKRGKYEITWLELGGCLMEGTKFRIRISQSIKRKSKSKKRGTKISESLRERYTLMLMPAADRYMDLAALPHAVKLQQEAHDFFDGQLIQPPSVEIREGRAIIQSMQEAARVYQLGQKLAPPFADTFCAYPLNLFRLAFAGLQSIKTGVKS